MFPLRLLTASLFAAVFFLSSLTTFSQTTWTVTTNLDDPSNPNSIRYAVNNYASGDIIEIETGIGGIIYLFNGQMTLDKDVTIRGLGDEAVDVQIDGLSTTRIFYIYNQEVRPTVTIEKIQMQNGYAGTGLVGRAGSDGPDGSIGSTGTSRIDYEHCSPPLDGGDGGDGGNGTPGSGGSAGGQGAHGGAIYNAGNLTVNYCEFIGNSAGTGGAGGDGGNGGNGGNGGPGGDGPFCDGCDVAGDGGDGGDGGLGAYGGNGGAGGAGGNGGAIYNAWFLSCNNSTFAWNEAGAGGAGGDGGDGGNGGSGGAGGDAGTCGYPDGTIDGDCGNGGDGASGASGGVNGSGGNGGHGGAIYNAGEDYSYENIMAVIKNCTFSQYSADEENGNIAGAGGAVGTVGTGGTKGTGGAGGSLHPWSGNSTCPLGSGLAGSAGATDGNNGPSLGLAGTDGNGGAIYNYTRMSTLNCTLDQNLCTSGGEGCGVFNYETATFYTANTLYSNNDNASGKKDFYDEGSGLVTQGYNICETTNVPGSFSAVMGDLVGTIYDPLLSYLAFYGGATRTKPIASASSPAINPASSNGAPTYDQRDYYRDGTADRGAYEYNGYDCPTTKTVADANITTTQTYRAVNYVILGGGTAFNVQSTGTLNAVGGTSVNLTPPFRAYSGSSVSLLIDGDPCNWSPSPTAPPFEEIDEPSAIFDLDPNVFVGVYPNPNEGTFTVSVSESIGEFFSVEIYNTTGAIVWKIDKIGDKVFNVNLSDAPQGMYLIKIASNGEIFTKKIILR